MTSTARPAHRTLAERAVAELQEAILSGRLAPGEPLRLERLADDLAMSPMPVREAVRELERLGLADHVPHRGARVAALSVDDLHDTYEARLALEGLALGRAARRFSAGDAERCHALLDEHVRAYRSGDERRSRELHGEFHFALYAASASEWLPRLIRPLWQNSERYRIASLYARASLERRRREHERIVEACVAHDPDEAVAALNEHLVLTANTVARRMGRRSDLFPSRPEVARVAAEGVSESTNRNGGIGCSRKTTH